MEPPSSETQQEHTPAFLSLGMLVLDELQFPSKETLYDVPGGSGAYSTLGARLATSAAQSKTVACILLTGDDFPASVMNLLHDWNITLEVRRVPGKKSTRGLLKYEDAQFGRKTFRYLTPPLQPSPKDLQGSALLHSTTFHTLTRPDDLEAQVSSLLSLRAAGCGAGETRRPPPLVIWEPSPPFCKAANLEAHLRACRRVHVFSPNHLELLALFEGEDVSSGRPFDRGVVEAYARRFLAASVEGEEEKEEEEEEEQAQGAAIVVVVVVVRAGEHGCLAVSELGGCCWLPPYYGSASPKVVDTTGAGNAFLGAFEMVLQSSKDVREAAVQGTVAASFALEQVGLPEKTSAGGRDLWNGEEFASRLQEYRSRLRE